MDYSTTISILLGGERIIDIDNLFHVKIWRFRFGLYSPLQLTVRRIKTYFPTLNCYSVNYWWQNPFYFRYLNPKIEAIIEKINENSNRH